MGTALKWFPDKRGLATGMIAAGYGLGAAATSAPLAMTIRSHGYRYAFLSFGLAQGLIIVLLGSLLIKPIASAARVHRGPETKPSQTLRTGVFWLIYLIYLLIAFGGMVITAQLGPIARDFGLENRAITILGISAPVLTLAVSIDNFANGITRPVAGFISDIIGRENMMLLMFSLEAIALAGMAILGRSPRLPRLRSADFSLLGRNLRHLPGHLRRLFRYTKRHRQQRPALHRERHRRPDRTAGQHISIGNRNLEQCPLRRSLQQSFSRTISEVRPRTDAQKPTSDRAPHRLQSALAQSCPRQPTHTLAERLTVYRDDLRNVPHRILRQSGKPGG